MFHLTFPIPTWKKTYLYPGCSTVFFYQWFSQLHIIPCNINKNCQSLLYIPKTVFHFVRKASWCITLTFSKTNFFYRTWFCQLFSQLFQFQGINWILFKVYFMVSRPYFCCFSVNDWNPVVKLSKKRNILAVHNTLKFHIHLKCCIIRRFLAQALRISCGWQLSSCSRHSQPGVPAVMFSK